MHFNSISGHKLTFYPRGGFVESDRGGVLEGMAVYVLHACGETVATMAQEETLGVLRELALAWGLPERLRTLELGETLEGVRGEVSVLLKRLEKREKPTPAELRREMQRKAEATAR